MGNKDKKDRNDNSAAKPLDPEDAALWERVAETAEPLRKGKNRAVDIPEPARQDETPHSPAAPKRRAPRPAPGVKTQPKPAPTPQLADFGRRAVRGIGSGRVSVDARIDLHGARQREAHASLKAFLARAQHSGHQHVLVITGKGGARDSDGGYERGVLNREVPRWLSEPEFREFVVSFAPAHKRHGGEGALYVRLRREGRKR